ncbi:B3/4 domain-containing protein [Paludibacterium sp. THUN1379]|uniref:B3/B4 domain-containing protein n=1 Tax=Paludibacterium sp. THUN1379 TaxID=3112107 RepID=UPI00308D7346|nr:B3/4 domain-containing protein [Paludibacterium sp. THUN1379]
MRCELDASLLAKYPDMQVSGLLVRGIDQAAVAALAFPAWPQAAEEQAEPVIRHWKALHKQLSGDKHARSSIAYLVKAANRDSLRRINPLVDWYNQASLRSLSPFGGEDIRCLSGALRLTLAQGQERFVPLGRPDEVQLPGAGEVVWLDGAGKVVCRALNWLESDLHKITGQTRDVVFVSERPDRTLPDPQPGMDWLAAQLAPCAAELQPFLLDRHTTQIDLGDA